MKSRPIFSKALLLAIAGIILATTVLARPLTTVKNTTTRAENPKGTKSILVLPYAFSTDSMGFTVGVGGALKGYGQEQLLLGATAEYSLSELFSDWKVNGGFGLRAMFAGGVVRFDVGFSDETTSAWVMFGHPF